MTNTFRDFKLILNHIQKFFEKEGFLIQNFVHDVATKILVIPSSKQRNYSIYITIGMSEQPMIDLPNLSDIGKIISGDNEQIRGAFNHNYA